MATAIVKYTLDKDIQRSEVIERFNMAAETTFKGMVGLYSKQFCYDKSTGNCLSVYHWHSKDHAEAFFSDNFIENFEKIVGVVPSFEILDCLVAVDNRAGDIIIHE